MSTTRRPAPWLSPAGDAGDRVQASEPESPADTGDESPVQDQSERDVDSPAAVAVLAAPDGSDDTAEIPTTREMVTLDQFAAPSLERDSDSTPEPLGRQLFTGAERRKHYDEPLSIFEDRPVHVVPVVGRQDRWVAAGEAVAAFISDEEDPVIS